MEITLGEVAALIGAFSQFVTVIKDLGNNYFRADRAWHDFPGRVQLLQDSHAQLEKNLKKYGQRQDGPLLEAVKEARRLLDGEVAELEKRRAETRKWYTLRGTVFYESVETHIAVAERAYTRISDHLNIQLQNDKVLRESVQRQDFLLPYHKDSRYVPFQISEMEIFSALEAAGQESAVVLLSGGPGQGKSTLARQVSLRYRDGNSRFTQVVMLECGPKIDVAAKQTELLQKLGGDSPQESQRDDFKVSKSLQDRLGNPGLLIVLDDLWEPELMSILLNLSGSGSGAKYLVTSQLANLCVSLNCKDQTDVPIEDLDQDHATARKILALHAGFEDQDIPENLQEIADYIVGQTGANPMVMATLGAQITKAGQDQVEVWESVSDDLFKLLDRETLVKVHGVGCQRTFWATMKLSIDTLSHEQKQLLVLMAMCRGASISKFALQFLYSSAILHEGCKMRDFLTLTKELKSRHLLAEKDTDLLSVHSLTRGFILEHMRETVKDVTILLNEADSDEKGEGSNRTTRSSVTQIIVHFYIDAELSTRATMQIDHFSNSMSGESNRTTIDTKRTVSESIIQLLVLEARPRNKWTEELSICADQVLVDFVCNDLLSDGDISKLLDSPTAIIPILTFLKYVCLLDESFWKKNSIQSTSSVPHSLLKILQENSCAKHHTQVASVLAGLCWCSMDNSKTVANVPGMLPQIALSLAQSHNPDLQRNAAIVLSACAYWDDDNHNIIISKFLDVPGLLDSLVDLLAEDENPDVQIAAGHAFSNLASAEPTAIKETIVSQPGLLAELVDSLQRSQVPQLQEYAARIVANLASMDDQALCDKVASHPGLVKNLVKSLDEDQNPLLQEHAARALQSLAANYIRKSNIAEWPELLERLTQSLTKSGNPILQETAAATLANILANIADTDDDTILVELREHSGLVYSLVKSLYEDQNVGLQEESARALCILASCRDGIDSFDEFMDVPGLLEGLVLSSLYDQNPHLELNIGGTRSNMQMFMNMISQSQTNALSKINHRS